MTRTIITSRAIICYIAGWLLGSLITILGLAAFGWDIATGIDPFALMFLGIGGAASLPLLIILIIVMNIWSEHLTSNLKIWCQVMAIAASALVPATTILFFLLAEDRSASLFHPIQAVIFHPILAVIWIGLTILTLPSAIISTGLFYFWSNKHPNQQSYMVM